MKRWIKDELKRIAGEHGANYEAVKDTYKRVLARIVAEYGVEGAIVRALEVVIKAVPELVAAAREKRDEADYGVQRYIAVVWPDEVDDTIAEARRELPGFEPSEVSIAVLTKGQDRGRVFVSIRMKESVPEVPALVN